MGGAFHNSFIRGYQNREVHSREPSLPCRRTLFEIKNNESILFVSVVVVGNVRHVGSDLYCVEVGSINGKEPKTRCVCVFLKIPPSLRLLPIFVHDIKSKTLIVQN